MHRWYKIGQFFSTSTLPPHLLPGMTITACTIRKQPQFLPYALSNEISHVQIKYDTACLLIIDLITVEVGSKAIVQGLNFSIWTVERACSRHGSTVKDTPYYCVQSSLQNILRENHHISVVWNWYHWVAIAYLYQSVGRGRCKIAIATKWYQFHTTDKCGFLFMPWIIDQYTFVRYTKTSK